MPTSAPPGSHDRLWVTMMDMGYPLHLIDLLAKLYRKQLAKIKVAGLLSEWYPVKKGVRQGCAVSPILVQHPSWDDEGDSGWISRWTTNWRANDHEPSLRWWHHPVGKLRGRTTGVGGLSRPSQPQIQPSLLISIDKNQGNGERRHSVLHTHTEWTIGAGEYVPIPWVSDYGRWWVYDRIPYQVK